MLQIAAKVCPWNVPNSYGEIIAKGAFDKFLARHPIVPMLVMHQGQPIGGWSDFEDRGDALWAKGSIYVPATPAMMAQVPEISISFRDFGPVTTFTRRRAEDFARCGATVPWDAQVVDQHVTRVAGLGEVSIVDRGSFEGTFYRVIQ